MEIKMNTKEINHNPREVNKWSQTAINNEDVTKQKLVATINTTWNSSRISRHGMLKYDTNVFRITSLEWKKKIICSHVFYIHVCKNNPRDVFGFLQTTFIPNNMIRIIDFVVLHSQLHVSLLIRWEIKELKIFFFASIFNDDENFLHRNFGSVALWQMLHDIIKF